LENLVRTFAKEEAWLIPEYGREEEKKKKTE